MSKNILFIIADQWRSDCLGRAGNKIIKTPNLDRLASEGVLFSNAYCQTNPCGPSRMCIFTGRYLCSTRATSNCMPLRDATENFGMDLKKAGYSPALLGYNDYALDPSILEEDDHRKTNLNYDNVLPGFEWVLDHEFDSKEYFDSLREKGYPEEMLCKKEIHKPNVPPEGPGEHLDCFFPSKYKGKEDSECWFITDKTIEYIEEQEKNRASDSAAANWVVSLNYIKPHPPNVACQEFLDLYDLNDMPEPLAQPDELTATHPYLEYFIGDKGPKGQQLKEFKACYYAMISEVDHNIGRLLDFLEKKGLKENTIIIFTSDHGEYLGDHYQVGKKLFYDQTMRIPYIIYDPSSEADASRGKILDHFVESIDSSVTILDLLEQPLSSRYQGRSLKNILYGKEADWRTEIHFEADYRGLKEGLDTDPNKVLWVVRDHDYKYVQFADEKTPPLLYDLKADPGEMNDIASDDTSASIIVKYTQKLIRWRMRNEDQRMQVWFDDVKRKK